VSLSRKYFLTNDEAEQKRIKEMLAVEHAIVKRWATSCPLSCEVNTNIDNSIN
jgi:hypothetical protein